MLNIIVKKRMLSKRKILKLRPVFKFNGWPMVDWFEIREGDLFCYIRSGLKHVDGETKSPFFYEQVEIGKNATKEAVKKFNVWWKEISKSIN
jgi:hypothetical protein